MRRTTTCLILTAVLLASGPTWARADDTKSAGSKDSASEEGAKNPAAEANAKWADHMGSLPFVIGFDKGMAEVELTGKPPMYFFTATW